MSKRAVIVAISVIVVAAVAAFFVVRSVYHSNASVLTSTAPKGPTIWVADDLRATGTGPSKRWYVECEDFAAPDDDEREIQVWVTDAQRKAHVKGKPCPLGDIKAYGKKVTAR